MISSYNTIIGLWITTWTTSEQPEVKFKHQIISLVDTKDSQTGHVSFLAWSTYPQFNVIHQGNLRIPLIKVCRTIIRIFIVEQTNPRVFAIYLV